jgi:hypothetical protein
MAEEAIERLRHGILKIAEELGFDTDLTNVCIREMNKQELIDKFIDLKELRLSKENARLVEYLLY